MCSITYMLHIDYRLSHIKRFDVTAIGMVRFGKSGFNFLQVSEALPTYTGSK